MSLQRLGPVHISSRQITTKVRSQSLKARVSGAAKFWENIFPLEPGDNP